MNETPTTEDRIRTMARVLAVTASEMLIDGPIEEVAYDPIKVTRQYKPRRLKMDMEHIKRRRLDKLKRKNPQWKRKNKLTRVKYMRKQGRGLKKRSDFVRKQRKRMGL